MLRWKTSALLLSLIGLLLALPLVANAHDPHECPPDYVDGPVIDGHIEQVELVEDKISLDRAFDIGESLFRAKFNHCDGQGRPATTGSGNKREADEPAFSRTSAPDSNSCAGCHNDPAVGGAGDIVANVFVLAQTLDPITESTSSEFSNFRNTLGMHGAGPIEMLAREMTTDLWAIRDQAVADARAGSSRVEISLISKGVSFGSIIANPDGSVDTSGVEGVDADLVIKPFHQSGSVISLREFTVNAMNHHHGMQAEERFDLMADKGADFDEDHIQRELTIGDITAVTLWQASLATPGRVMPTDPAESEQVAQGEQLFGSLGCTGCHVPEMKLESRFFVEPSPYNPAGTWADTTQSISFDMTRQGSDQRMERDGAGAIVHAFTDLKRHDLCDEEGQADAIRHYCNEELLQNRPDLHGRPGTEFFITRKLWDVGNTAPYGHVGDLTTIAEAILMHGGEGRESRDAYVALSADDQTAIVAFLKTLQVLPPGNDLTMTEKQVAAVQAGKTPPVNWLSFLSGIVLATIISVPVFVITNQKRK